MKFPRLPWGPEVPPSNTEEGETFTLRYLLALTALCVVVGVIYATRIVGNDQTFGILVLTLSVAMLFLCWRIVRVRRRRRATKSELAGIDEATEREGLQAGGGGLR